MNISLNSLVLYVLSIFFHFKQEGQTCVSDSNCDSGLHCETCVTNGNVRPRCTRIQPISPTSKVHTIYTFNPICNFAFLFVFWTLFVRFECESERFDQVKGLPFNRYSWLTTHNSFAMLGQKSATGSVILSPTNQQDSITSQLNVCHFLFLFLFFILFVSRENLRKKKRKCSLIFI